MGMKYSNNFNIHLFLYLLTYLSTLGCKQMTPEILILLERVKEKNR